MQWGRGIVVVRVIVVAVIVSVVVIAVVPFGSDPPATDPLSSNGPSDAQAPPATTSTAVTGDNAAIDWGCLFPWVWGPKNPSGPTVAWTADCYPTFAVDDLWWLATSQVLADNDTHGAHSWERELLAFCAWIDDLVAHYEFNRTLISDRFILATLEPKTTTANAYADSGGVWGIKAVAAVDRYCPEHRSHLPPLREERLSLSGQIRFLQHRAAGGLPDAVTNLPLGPQ